MSELADYFSSTFLVSVSCIFVQAIIYLHVLLETVSGNETRDIYKTILTIEVLIRIICILNAICYMADKIKHEVMH